MSARGLRLAKTYLFSIVLAFSFAAAAMGDEASSILARKTGLPLKAEVHTSVGSRPEFYTEPGQYATIEGYLNYEVHKKLRYQLYQSVTFPDRIDSPEESATQIGDTKLRAYWPSLFANNPYGISTMVRADATVLANSLASKNATLSQALATRLYLVKTYKGTTFSIIPEYKVNFHKETLNKDGVPNAPHQLSTIFHVGYAWKKLNAGLAYVPVKLLRYKSVDPVDRYVFNPEVSYAHDERVSLAVGMETQDTQLKSGKRAPVYLYKENLSQVYARLETTL